MRTLTRPATPAAIRVSTRYAVIRPPSVEMPALHVWTPAPGQIERVHAAEYTHELGVGSDRETVRP